MLGDIVKVYSLFSLELQLHIQMLSMVNTKQSLILSEFLKNLVQVI